MHEKGFPYLNGYTKYLRYDIWDLVKGDENNGKIPEDFELFEKESFTRRWVYD